MTDFFDVGVLKEENGSPMSSLFAEHRLCSERMSGPGYWADWKETYLHGNAAAKAGGLVSLVAEGSDVLMKNILGGRYEKPDRNPIGHITRDIRQTVEYISDGEVFAAIGNIIGITGSAVMDVVDGATGARRN